MNGQVKDLLGFSSRLPAEKLVIQQLDEAIKFWNKLSEHEKQDMSKRFAIESVCRKIYEFFDDRIVNNAGNRFLNELGRRHWLFLQGKFVQSCRVANSSKGKGEPFLFSLPSNYKRDYRNLFEAMKIKHGFDNEDYIHALYELESTKQGSTLTEDELHIAVFFINEIDVENPIPNNYMGNIPLPDTNGILRRSKDIVVNLSLWLKDPDENLKVHEKIPPHTAQALGAKPLKNVILEKCSHPVGYVESFGQYEDLTDRLKGILDAYPTDGILKELVQNADDAEASEIHFIHDTRSLGCEKVAIEDETCEEIQGPALCVYNDRPFTDNDLEGIKKLGIGGKRDAIETTGRYGIGFNAVYHLTDCPSFLSNDDTLVILDPHRRYVLDKDPGKKFKLTAQLRNDCSDTLNGYLAGYFNLKGSTMFRFPLRQKSNESKICRVSPNMEELLKTFHEEARKSLLFLNHVKKITLSKIHLNNKLEKMYQVETVIRSGDEKKRQDMARKICELSGTPTVDIGWESVNYTVTIKENSKEVDKWLIQKCIGSIITKKKHSEIPDGRKLGLFPRGGLAARLWTHPSPSGKQPALSGIVYCFLPLPENYSELPVHVNGHFALDNNRRGLWRETDGVGEKSKWNDFMKTCLLAPAYAALIQEARNHLCNDEEDNKMSRYYALFPKVLDGTPWKPLTTELYRYLAQKKAKVLPLLVPIESESEAIPGFLQNLPGTSLFSKVGGLMMSYVKKTDTSEKQPLRVKLSGWFSVEQTYFGFGVKDEFLHLLIRIGLHVLLHAPLRIHRGFKSAKIILHDVSPRSIICFLREFKSERSTCKINNLPKKLETTAVKTVPELSALIDYCCEEDDFGTQLEGLPLLLTQDGYLRVFESRQPVFRSKFGDLFPTQLQLFVHSQIIYNIPWNATKSEENIVREFTVRDFAELLPLVFTDKVLQVIKDNDTTWEFPDEGILSEQWFKKCWDFLQNHAKPEPEEDFVSLECLLEWPVIPTKCGKLVTIRDAKYVLDMTSIGNESTEQLNAREFLSILNCPVLNNNITSNDGSVSEDDTTTQTSSKKFFERKTAVTDPYVAHPHNVLHVLTVLHHMLKMSKLNLSEIHEEKILDFLTFVQSNYERLEMVEQCKQMVKDLPFHKTLDEQFVSLIFQSSSYVFVPTGVPTEQIDKLQERSKCRFLSSDALPALEKLYGDLGVRAGQDVIHFYLEYVFKHFSMFTRESQMKHLVYVRDKVCPSLPEVNILLPGMSEIPCIPDENGNLHFAREFVDPYNEMFKMFEDDYDNMFLPSPFDREDWFKLLCGIGLQVDISPQLFQKFSTAVARVGKDNSSNQQNRKRSEELVKCLFSEKTLQDGTFLSKVSQIKFIAPAKVEEELTSVQKQYQCPENGKSPFFEFKDAVPWHYRDITWTTAHILPIWAQPNNMAKLKNLRIACSGPKYTNVLHHLQNVAKSYNSGLVDSNLIHKITKAIYQFLLKATKFCSRIPNDECSNDCIDIGIGLKSVACIFLQEDKGFVKAEQLVFKLPENISLKPYVYLVPREFGELEHFLKRLGATERPSLLQVAFVLNSIHNEVGEKILAVDMETKVKYAMCVLFELLYRGESADEISELYLPNESKQLVKSSDMICKVSPRFMEVIEKLQRPILLRFEECGLNKIADGYIDALPKRLRPTKFDEIFREEVDPDCNVHICPEADGSTCKFQQQFEDLLRSDEFQVGLKRLLVDACQDPREFEQGLKKLQTGVKTKCIGFENIKIYVINRNSDDVVAKLEDSSYAVQEEGIWSLYIQHDFKDYKNLVSIVTCVNKILGDCIKKELGMVAMLGCSSPNEITKALDKLEVTRSTFRTENEFDDELPSGSDYHGGGGGGGGGRGGRTRIMDDEIVDERFYPASREEAKRWLQQSRCDLESAMWLLRSGPPFSAHACFQSQQVVEKCLKAMLYYSCGISGRLLESHKVDDLARKLVEETGKPDGAEMQSVRRVAWYYLSTRYPNRQPFDVVPAEAFKKNDAEMAIDAASTVLEFVDEYCL